MTDRAELVRVIDRDFESVEAALKNGGAGDPEVIGRALSILLRHMRILVARATVSEEECSRRRTAFGGGGGGIPLQMLRDLPPWGVVAFLIWRFMA